MSAEMELAQRVLARLPQKTVVKRMFGGQGYFLGEHLCVAVWKASLVARIGVEAAESALTFPGVKPFAPTGRPMKGWVQIDHSAIGQEEDLDYFLTLAQRFVRTLPPKS